MGAPQHVRDAALQRAKDSYAAYCNGDDHVSKIAFAFGYKNQGTMYATWYKYGLRWRRWFLEKPAKASLTRRELWNLQLFSNVQALRTLLAADGMSAHKIDSLVAQAFPQYEKVVSEMKRDKTQTSRGA